MFKLLGINKSYPAKSRYQFTVDVLNDLSLTIKAGEFVQIVGPSGSGKSTLLYILGLLTPPSSGEYLLNDVEVSSISETEKERMRLNNFGFIFQDYWLLERLTVRENIEFPMKYAGIKPSLRKERAAILVEQMGLTERIDFLPGHLSGGEKQRVAIARALANEPQALFADEPTGNLDLKTSSEIMDLLADLNKKKGISIVMVTHDIRLNDYADSVYLLEKGSFKQLDKEQISSLALPH